jgi:hypothetical protein
VRKKRLSFSRFFRFNIVVTATGGQVQADQLFGWAVKSAVSDLSPAVIKPSSNRYQAVTASLYACRNKARSEIKDAQY